MRTTETIDRCTGSETEAATCTTSLQLGEGRCCDTCGRSADAHAPRTLTTEHPEPPDAAPVIGAGRKKRWTPEEEDRLVEAVLELAAQPGDRIEHADAPSVEALRGLAKSRGVTLEHVVRADLRGQLADVVTESWATKPH